MMRACLYLVLPVLAITEPLSAQSVVPAAVSAQSTTGLEDAAQSGDAIVVTANRTATPLSRVGQSITVFDATDIRTRQAVTVTDLLRTAPGVSVAQNGGTGTSTSVFIRGAESDQTVALIDGVKLNDPSSPGGGFNFGDLLVGNIDRIEVLRGAQSVLWGSQAIGGVINLITRQPTDMLSINARTEGGYHDSGQGVVNVSDRFGPLSASVGGGYFRTDGISAFDRQLGGTERDGYRNYGANASFNLALSHAISVDLRGYYTRGRTDIDGFPPPDYVLADDGEYARNREFVGYTGLNAALFDGAFRNRFGYAYTDTKRRNFDPDSDPVETFAGNGRNERLEYQGIVDLAATTQATFGAERETSRYSTASYGGPATGGRARIESGYGQIVVTPIAGLTATGGVRYDHHSQFGGKTSLSGSGVYTPNGGSTTFRASYSEGFKAPSLYQLLGDYGNATLRPERSKGWDAGITQRALDGAVEASATYFRRRSRDLIDFVSCTDLTGICTDRPFGTYDNVAAALSQGAELTFAVKPVAALRITANYTYLDARNRSPGDPDFDNRLARRPANTVNLTADYSWPFGLETGATLSHASSSFNDAANSQRVQGYILADVRASYPIGRHLSVYGRIQNLFDAHYETIYQYGQPGRAAYGGIRLSY